jgi:hypothetical protein
MPVKRMASRGNVISNEMYAPYVPPTYRRMRAGDPDYVREDWIESKYVRKTFSATHADRTSKTESI